MWNIKKMIPTSLKDSKFLNISFSVWFQVLLSISMLLLLGVFLTGNPAKELLPLWSNAHEVKNAAIYLIICIVISALTTFGKKNSYFILSVLLALLLTAGPAATLWAVFTSIAAIALGYQVVGGQAVPLLATSNIGRFALAFWIGKSVYLLLLTILSFFPINGRFMHGCVIVALLLLSPRGVIEARRVMGLFIQRSSIGSFRINAWAVSKFFFLLALLLLILAAIHPGFDGDAGTMHMRVGREMLNKGFWSYDVTEYGFAVMPLAPQLNFSAMFLAGGIEAVKVELVLQFFFALALVVTGGGFRVSPIGLAFGAVFCLTPMFVREISSLFIEVTLCGFMVASAVLVASAVRRKSLEITFFAALCAAGAMATKIFGLLLVPILFLVFLYNRRALTALSTERKIKLFLVAGAAMALALFFYVVAWVKTGNPFFPFYNGVFKSPYWDAVNFMDRRWVDHLSWNLPWEMTFDSSKFEESSNGSMGLSLLFLAISGISLLALTRKTLVAAIPLCIGVAYLLGVGLQIQYLRYLLPGFLLIAISLVFCLRLFVGRIVWPLLFITLLSLFVANFFGMPSGKFTNGMLHIPFVNRFITGSLRGMPSFNFTEESLNGHKYVADVLNATVRQPPTVLMLGCSYGAYFNGKTIYTNWTNYSWTVRESQLLNAFEFTRYLDDNNVSHVVIDGCTTDQRISFVPLVKTRAIRIAELSGVELYQIRR